MILAQGLFIVFGIFFNPLLEEFGWTRAAISGAYSLSSIFQGVLGIAMGGLVDRFGPRIVVTVCGVFLGAGYLLMSQVNTVWQIYLFYGVIIGIGMSGLWVPLLSPINRWFVTRRSLMTGIGMLISAMASQQQTATTIMMTLTLPMMFLSGAFFPIQQMPQIMQWISRVLPLTYAVDALRKCMVLGTGISGMTTEIFVMAGFGAVFMVVAIPIFRKVITR